jgi:hypothetical protein
MTKLMILIVFASACGGSKDTEQSPAPKAVEPAAAAKGSAAPAAKDPAPPVAAKDAPPCPKAGEALDKQLAKLYGVKAVTDGVCVAGHFPQPAWLVSGRFESTEPDSSMIVERMAMVDPAGKITFKEEYDMPWGQADSSGMTDVKLIDFEKDGIDELVYVASSDRRGYMSSSLHVQRWTKGKWEPVFDRNFEYDDSAAEANPVTSCKAAWKIDAAAKTITFDPEIKSKQKDTGEDCVHAKEIWTLGADGKFAKAGKPAK